MADREPYKWITVKGKHIPVYKDEHGDDVFGLGQDEEPLPNYEDSLDYNDFVKKNLKKLKEVYEKHKHDNDDVDYIKEEWYRTRLAQEKKDIHEIDIDEAFEQIDMAIPQRYRHMWFVEADSDIKPHIVDSMMMSPGTLNAALNVAYYNYRGQFERYSSLYQKWIPHEGVDQSKKMSFTEWLNTPMELWRGDRGQKEVKNDIFRSYSPDKRVAAGFTFGDSGSHLVTNEEMKNINPENLTGIKIKPIDTFGSYSTNGELEYLVPKSKLRKGGK